MPRSATNIRSIFVTGVFALVGLSACTQESPPQSTVRAAAKSETTEETPEPVIPKPPDSVAKSDVEKDPAPPIAERPQQVFRPDDLRPRHDDARLAEAGIRVFESKRLKLYTDIDPEVARTLPPLIDQLHIAWDDYLGPLPPDRAGSDFQISGFLMRDMALFRELKLVPDELYIEHGRHMRNEFWMRDQGYDYYRRHLLIHEATHCIMTFMPEVAAPVWYLEGMAEYFGAHRLDSEKRATFRVVPTSRQEFMGFDRITTIRDDVAARKLQTLPSIFAFQPIDFRTTNHYAWSWAACMFLDRTPRYHERFQKLSRFTQGGQFLRVLKETFDNDQRDLETEWSLFATNLQYGYDFARAAIDFQPGDSLTDEKTVKVDSDRGWQSTRIRLEKGQVYKVAATGQFTLADQPKPWVCEPQGITFRYFDGRPLGMLLGCLRTEEGPVGGMDEPMLQVFAIGRSHEFQAPITGTLYLRLNDAWNSLHDNRGKVSVTIRPDSNVDQ